MKVTVFDDAGAKAKYKAMLEHLASLNLPFQGKSVLEVGSGVGWHTYFFEQRNCKVLCTDGRSDNVDEHRSRFPHRRVELVDMDIPHSHDREKYGCFNIVHCYSVLYHLQDPAQTISDLAAICDDFLIIETDVLKEDADRIEFRTTEPTIASQSIHGVRNVVGRPWLWRELKKHFPFVYCPITQPDHADYPLRFPAPINGKAKKIIMIGSRIDLSNILYGKVPNPTLVADMPIHYKSKTGDPLLLKGEVYEVPIAAIDMVGRFGRPCDFYPEKVDDLAANIKVEGLKDPIRLKYQTGKGRFKPADGVHRILAISTKLGGTKIPARVVAFDSEIDPLNIAEKPTSDKKDVVVVGLNDLGISLATVVARCGDFRVTGIDPNQERVDKANSCERGFLSISDLRECDGVLCAFIVDGNASEVLQAMHELKTMPEAICIVKTQTKGDLEFIFNNFPQACYCPVTYEDPMLPKLVILGGPTGRSREIALVVLMSMYDKLTIDKYNMLTLFVMEPAGAYVVKTLLDEWNAMGRGFLDRIASFTGPGVEPEAIKEALKTFEIGNWNENF